MDSSHLLASSENLSCPSGQQCQLMEELLILRGEIDELRHQVQTDALTGLYNFRFFSSILPLEMERSRRSTTPLSLIILDIDHFKQFNDTWGHETGNQALVHVSELIKVAIRKLDFACRFGGEEFAIVLPNTEVHQALNVAERLRHLIANSELEINGNTVRVTASLGIDEFKATDAETTQEFIERVDSRLYMAKAAGRNTVKGPIDAPLDVDTNVTADEKDALFTLFKGAEE